MIIEWRFVSDEDAEQDRLDKENMPPEVLSTRALNADSRLLADDAWRQLGYSSH